jgi:hypothetical protein
MKINSLGFDFSNLSTCTIKKKNKLLSLVMFILTGSFLPMPIIFIVLYFTKSPIEINGDMVNFGESAYNAFFYPFIGVFLSISILFLVIGIASLTKKPKIYMVIDRDTTNYDKIYYIYDYHKKEEIYLTEKYAISYNSKYNIAKHEADPDRIKNYFNDFVFWYNFENIDDAKITQRKNSTVVKIKTPTNFRYSGSVIKRYVFSNNINVVPEIVSETIGYSRTGSTSYQSKNSYFFEGINRSQHLQIHPEIKKVLHGLT